MDYHYYCSKLHCLQLFSLLPFSWLNPKIQKTTTLSNTPNNNIPLTMIGNHYKSFIFVCFLNSRLLVSIWLLKMWMEWLRSIWVVFRGNWSQNLVNTWYTKSFCPFEEWLQKVVLKHILNPLGTLFSLLKRKLVMQAALSSLLFSIMTMSVKAEPQKTSGGPQECAGCGKKIQDR